MGTYFEWCSITCRKKGKGKMGLPPFGGGTVVKLKFGVGGPIFPLEVARSSV